MRSLVAKGRLDRPAFDALVRRAKAAGVSQNECHPLYQYASILGLVRLSEHFPTREQGEVLRSEQD